MAANNSPLLIALAGLKNGTGRTTLAINLAACLSAQGYRTLLADCDTTQDAYRWAATQQGTTDSRFNPSEQVVSCVEAAEEEGHSPLAELQQMARKADADILITDLPATRDYRSGALLSAADVIVIPANGSVLEQPALNKMTQWLRELRENGARATAFILPVLDVPAADTPKSLTRYALPFLPAITRSADFASGLAPIASPATAEVSALAGALIRQLQPSAAALTPA
jgi:chromosome partitioning protein